jgi:hypothetical protein
LRLPRACRRIIGLAGLGLALVLLQGCSAIKLAYNNLPDIGYWWIDSYIDMNDEQSPKVRDELIRLQQWHRSAELPKVIELLQKLQRLAPADTSAEVVCGLFADVRNRTDAVIAQAEPAAVALAMSITPSQITHLEAKYAKNNAEWRSSWGKGGPAERRERRLKSSVERAEQFYGTLGERQLAALRASIERSDFDPQLSFAERIRRQQDLIQTLRRVGTEAPSPRPTAAQATTLLRGYQERSTTSPNPAYRAYMDRATLDACRTIAQLHNATSPEQRERARQRLAAYERDARELAPQP